MRPASLPLIQVSSLRRSNVSEGTAIPTQNIVAQIAVLARDDGEHRNALIWQNLSLAVNLDSATGIATPHNRNGYIESRIVACFDQAGTAPGIRKVAALAQ